VRKLLERVILGTAMTVLAFVLERRMVKALKTKKR
jgi:hypothetical protein